MAMPILYSWIARNKDVKLYQFNEPLKSVRHAVDVSGYPRENFVKTIMIKHKTEDLVVAAIITSSARVDKKLILEGIGPRRWRMASEGEIFEKTGFPVGGVPPVCLGKEILKYVDPRVLKKDFILGGGGTITSLISLPPNLIVEDGTEVKVISKG